MRPFPGAAATALAALLVLGSAACKDVGGLPTGSAGPGDAGGGAGSGAGAGSAPRTVVVEITGFEFRGPSGTSRIEVAAGDTLEFVNLDTAPHTATTNGFDSGRLNRGERWRTVVTAAGTAALRCDFHPAMTGTIAVAARDGATGGSGGSGGSGDPGGGSSGPGDGGGSGTPGDGSSGPGGGGASGPGGDPGAAIVVVEIRDDVFVGPGGSSRIEVATGSTVRFVNRGGSAHTATSTSVPSGGTGFDSGRMDTLDTFEVVVDQAGTWAFRCDFHDGMTGTLVVTDGGPAGGGGGTGGGGPGGTPGDGSGSGGSGAVVVTIDDAGFSGGGNVTLELGRSVEWVNASAVEHEIDSTDEPDDAPEIESGDLAPGARFRFTPDRTGTWTYRCKEHGDERGMTVTVR